MTVDIDEKLYDKLLYLGILNDNSVRNHNVGESDYSKHIIQPWSIWLDYPDLSAFDCDIIKRVLRNKSTEDDEVRYGKIMHICQERLRQIKIQKQ